MSNITKPPQNILQQMKPEHAAQLVGRQAGRQVMQQGGQYLAKEAAKKAGRQLGKQIVKGGGNPFFIVGDIAEMGVEAMTDNKIAAKSTSFAVYVGAGAVAGGPVGAGVAAGFWGVGQCMGALIDKAF